MAEMYSRQSDTDAAFQYVKNKLKELRMTQEKLAYKLYSDRITIYRRLKNQLPLTEDFKQSLYKALALKQTEADELETLFLSMEFGEEAISAYQAMDEVFFEPSEPEDTSFLFECHDDVETHYFKARAFLNEVFTDTADQGFQCEATVINCVDNGLRSKLLMFLECMGKLGEKCAITQYVNLPDGNMERFFEMFSNLAFRLPLLPVENYSAYVNMESKTRRNMFFDNSIICTMSAGAKDKKRKHYWFVLSEENISTCARFTDEGCFAFIQQNIDNYTKQFHNILFSTTTDDKLTRDIMERRSDTEDELMFGPDPGYGMIPPHVYQSYKERCLNEMGSKGILFFADSVPRMDLWGAVDYYFNREKIRYEMTFNRKRTDVFSASGLREFALTGRLSDCIDGLLLFSEREVVEILSNLYKRAMDSNDSYTLYITRKEMLNNQFFIDMAANGDIMIEPLFTRADNHFKCLRMDHKGLSDLFFQYMKSWLLPRYAMSRKECLSFLSKLIIEAGDRSGDYAVRRRA